MTVIEVKDDMNYSAAGRKLTVIIAVDCAGHGTGVMR